MRSTGKLFRLAICGIVMAAAVSAQIAVAQTGSAEWGTFKCTTIANTDPRNYYFSLGSNTDPGVKVTCPAGYSAGTLGQIKLECLRGTPEIQQEGVSEAYTNLGTNPVHYHFGQGGQVTATLTYDGVIASCY